MPKRSNLFQDVVGIIQRHMADGAIVEESCMLRDRVTGEDREVDVVIRSTVAGEEILVAVEAVATARKADVVWVERMVARHKDLPTHKLVLVSERGYSQAAKAKAEFEGATLLAPVDMADGDPVFTVVNNLKSLWPKTVALTPTATELLVQRPDGAMLHFAADPGIQLFHPDGQAVGLLIECIRGLMEKGWLKLMEDIELANISDDRDEFFKLTIDAPIRAEVDGRSEELSVHHEEADELHAIRGLTVTGRAVIHVTQIDLKHQRLGEVGYAFGESDLGDQQARLVVTETAQGGALSIRLRDKKPGAKKRRKKK